MARRSLRDLLVVSARKLLGLGHRHRKVRPARRTRLALEQMEDRTLLAMLAPGMMWSDQYWDASGTFHPGTVYVLNTGATALEVTGGGGAASIAPYEPPPGGGDYGGDYGGTGIDGGDYGGDTGDDYGGTLPAYSAAVHGMNGHAGDASWSGEAGWLSLTATGSVAGITIGGGLYVAAGVDIGPLSAQTVTASAGRHIGAVTAGAVGTLTAGGNIASAQSTGNIGTVSAQGDVGPVAAGGNIGTWNDDPDASAPPYGPGTGGVIAGGAVTGAVSAGGHIALLRAGGDIGGPVQAAGSIGFLRAGTPASEVEYGGPVPEVPGGILGDVFAGGDLLFVRAQGDIAGLLSAGGAIVGVTATGSILGDVSAVSEVGRLPQLPSWNTWWYPEEPRGVWAGGDVVGSVTAGGDIVGVWAKGSITGSVGAGRDVFGVTAQGHVTGPVSATRDVGVVQAGVAVTLPGEEPTAGPLPMGHVAGSVTAGRDVAGVYATGDVAGWINATAGSVGGVGAQRSIASTISAWIDIGRLSGLDGQIAALGAFEGDYGGGGGLSAGLDITGPVTAVTGGISRVWAGQDIGGSMTAGVGIGYLPGEVPPWEDPYFSGFVPPQVEAGRDIIGSLTAQTGNIGWVKEYTDGGDYGGDSTYVRYGGGVLAGRHIDGHIRAEQGGLAPVVAGAESIGHGPGRLGGDVFAAKYDVSVAATGDATGAVTAGWGVDLTAGGKLTGNVTAPGGPADVAVGREVNAAVFGQKGVILSAGLGVAGSVVAGDDDNWADAEVAAGGLVSAPVSASGAAYVGTSGAVTGPVTGWGDVGVNAGEDVVGNVASLGSAASVTTYGSVTGAVSAPYGVTISAGGNVTGAVTAGDLSADAWGWAEVLAGGDVGGDVSAAGGAWVAAGGAVTGSVTTTIDAAVVAASGDVTGAVSGDYAFVAGSAIEGPVSGLLGVEARALGDITGALTSDGGHVTAWTGRHVAGPVAAELEVYLEAGGDVSGAVTAGDADTWANALVRATGNVSGNVSATWTAEAWAGGDISGDVLAGDGEAVAIAAGMVRGAVGSNQDRVRVWAAKGTGKPSGDPSGDPGPDWLMVVLNGEAAELTHGILIDRAAEGPGLVAATFADPPPAQPPGPGDDRGLANAAAAELMLVPRFEQPAAGGTPEGVPVEPRSDWTLEEYLRRGEDLTAWWANLDPNRAEALQNWWRTASNAERWELLKDLFNTDSWSERLYHLDNRTGPPPEGDPPPPSEVGPPARTGPTDAELKLWEQEAAAYLKASAAEADAAIGAYDADGRRRSRYAVTHFRLAYQIERANNGFATQASMEHRGWGDHAVDRLNFDLPADGPPVPLTPEGKAKAAALKQKIEGLYGLRDMTLQQKLGAAIQRALDAKDENGESRLKAELREAVLELVQPENLGVMATVLGVVGLSTATPLGPFVVGAVGLFGYVMTGVTVIDVTKDAYMFFSIAAGARRPEDLDKAAEHFIAAAKTLVGEGAAAGAVVGAAKVGKGLNQLKQVADGQDAKDLAVRRADGKVQVNDGQPAGGAQQAAQPVPPPLPPPGARRHRAPDAPAHLSDAAKQIWKDLYETLGPEAMDPFIAWAGRDGYDLNDALPKLKSMLGKLLASTQDTQRKRRLFRWEHLVSESSKRVHLRDIFNSDILQNSGVTLQRLLDDLDKVADLEGAVSAFKRLSNQDATNGPGVIKGVLAEIQLAAKEAETGADGLNIPFTSKIDGQEVTLTDGTKMSIKEGTDAAIVAKGRLWQVKVGPDAIESVRHLEGWLRQAAEAVKAGTAPGGATRVGLKLDANAAASIGIDASGTPGNNTKFKMVWEKLKEGYGPDMFADGIEIVIFPNP